MGTGKGLTYEENERLRAAIGELLEQYKGNQSKLAPRLGAGATSTIVLPPSFRTTA